MILATKMQKKHSRKDVTKALKKQTIFHDGDINLIAKQSNKLSINQIHFFRNALRKLLRKQGKVWYYSLSFKFVTKKPNEIRLGKGKGNIKYKAISIRPGKTLIGIKTLKSNNELVKIKKIIRSTSFLRLKHQRWIL